MSYDLPRALPAPPLGQLVAQRCDLVNQGVSASSGAQSATYVDYFTIPHDCEGLQLEWANVTSAETPGPNKISMRASLTFPGASPVALTFGGELTADIAPGAPLRCDYLSFSAWAADSSGTAQIRTYVTVEAGLDPPRTPRVTTSRTGGTLGNGQTYGYRVTAINASGETLPSQECYVAIPAALTTPTITSVTGSTTGGTLAAGTFTYRATLSNGLGETLASAEVSGTVASGTTGSCAIVLPAATGNVNYKIYGRAAGVEVQIAALSVGATTFTDTGASGTGAALPGSNTTQTTTNSNTITWLTSDGATNYGIYGRTLAGELLIATVGNVRTFTDTGSVTPSVAPPVTNTARGLSWPFNSELSSLGGTNFATTNADDTMTGATIAPTSGFSFGPTLIVGTVPGVRQVSIALVGDSITKGTGSNGPISVNAWGSQAAVSASLPCTNIAAGGELGNNFGSATGHPHRGRHLGTITHALVMYGTNDIHIGGLSLAALQVALLRVYRVCQMAGGSTPVKVYGATIIPQTNSTDNWATLVNQSSMSAGENTVRVNFNNWLRAGAPIDPTTRVAVAVGTSGALLIGQAGHFLTGYVETADAVESARDSGLWKVTGSAFGWTIDGSHPTQIGHTAMAVPARAAMQKMTLVDSHLYPLPI